MAYRYYDNGDNLLHHEENPGAYVSSFEPGIKYHEVEVVRRFVEIQTDSGYICGRIEITSGGYFCKILFGGQAALYGPNHELCFASLQEAKDAIFSEMDRRERQARIEMGCEILTADAERMAGVRDE